MSVWPVVSGGGSTIVDCRFCFCRGEGCGGGEFSFWLVSWGWFSVSVAPVVSGGGSTVVDCRFCFCGGICGCVDGRGVVDGDTFSSLFPSWGHVGLQWG